MRKNKYIIVWFVFLITLLPISFVKCRKSAFPIVNIKTIRASSENITKSTIAYKDTYVSNKTPTDNFGGQHQLYVGIDINNELQETYISFNYSTIPDNITRAEIKLKFHSVSKTAYLDVYLTDNDWNEFYTNWNNRSSKKEYITQLAVANEETIYNISVESYIKSRNNISICLFSGNNQSQESVYLDSREWTSLWSTTYHPKLIWSYINITVPPPPPDGLTPVDNGVILSFLIGVPLIISITIIFVVLRRKITEKREDSLNYT